MTEAELLTKYDVHSFIGCEGITLFIFGLKKHLIELSSRSSESFKVLTLELQALCLDFGMYKIKKDDHGETRGIEIDLMEKSKTFKKKNLNFGVK